MLLSTAALNLASPLGSMQAMGSAESDSPTILKFFGFLEREMLLAKLYNKWFMQPTPPNNVVVGLPLTEKTKEAWTNPNNKPAEDYKL